MNWKTNKTVLQGLVSGVHALVDTVAVFILNNKCADVLRYKAHCSLMGGSLMSRSLRGIIKQTECLLKDTQQFPHQEVHV